MFYDGDWSKALRQLMSDVGYNCVERFILDAFFKTGQPFVFHYVMTLPVTLTLPDKDAQALGCSGPGHGDDVLLLMASPDLPPDQVTSTETALGYRMRQYWATFAKNHTPDA